MSNWQTWPVGFGLTLALELPIVLGLLRSAPSFRRRLAVAIFANLATHPLVWFFFPQLPLPYRTIVTLSELWAWGAETVIYATVAVSVSWRWAAWISLLANGTSFCVGWVVAPPIFRWLFH